MQPNWRHRRKGKKETGRVPSLKKTPEGSWPNGNEPQGLLCFAGRSSACEKPLKQGSAELFKPVSRFYRLSQPCSTLHVTAEPGGPNSGCCEAPECLSLPDRLVPGGWAVRTQAHIAVMTVTSSEHHITPHMEMGMFARYAILYKTLIHVF